MHDTPRDVLSIRKSKSDFVDCSQQSGDNFLGVLSSREMYLATNQQQTIQVTNMRVPDRPEGTKVVHTLRVSIHLTNVHNALSSLHVYMFDHLNRS